MALQVLVVVQARGREIKEEEEGREERFFRSRMGYKAEVTKLPLFSREVRQVVGCVAICKLYIRMRMRKEEVEKQV